MKEEIINHEGKEYVSIQEFAKRKRTTIQTIYSYIRKKKLTVSDPAKKGGKYLEWKTQGRKYDIVRKKNEKTTPHAKRASKDRDFFKPQTSDEPKPAELENLPKPQENNMPDLPGNNLLSSVNLSLINPKDHPDCWMTDPETLDVLYDAHHHPMLDWDKVKAKLTAVSYQLKIDQLAGSLVPKDELMITIEAVSQVFLAGISSIPARYGSIFIAEAEKIFGREATPEEQMRMNKILVTESRRLCETMQGELRKMKSDE